MTNYPRDEASLAWHDTPQTTRRDRALMDGFDPHPDDAKPSAQWVQDQQGGELLDALARSVEQARAIRISQGDSR